MIIILVGPQNCGKTRNAEKLCRLTGCATFVDENDIDAGIDKAFMLSNSNKVKTKQHGLIDNPYFDKDILVLTNEAFTLKPEHFQIKAVYNYNALESQL